MNVFRWALGPLVVTLALLSACGGSSEPVATPDPATTPVHSRPATLRWEPTGEYRTERMGIGLTVHTFSISFDRIRIIYSLDHSAPGLSASPQNVALTDDLGQSYAITSDVILGSALGVTGGVLTAEPYKGQGRTLSLTVTDMSVSSDGSAARTVSGAWSVTFVENTAPGTPVDYSQGSRISPGIMSAGQLKIGLPAFGSPFIKLVVDRAGQQGALYGRISNGVAQPLTETDFHRLMEAETGTPDFSYPTGWPSDLSMEQAKQVALEGAAHLLQDRPVEVQDTIIYGLMPYRRAAAQVDSERLASPPDDALVWMIAFKGFFYPLQGPAGAGSPAQPVCSEIITLVNDATGEYFMGTIRPADFCLTT